MSEPLFIARGTMTDDPADSRQWFREQTQEAHTSGCGWIRGSYDEDRRLLLLEGWVDRPDEEGQQRWTGDPTPHLRRSPLEHERDDHDSYVGRGHDPVEPWRDEDTQRGEAG